MRSTDAICAEHQDAGIMCSTTDSIRQTNSTGYMECFGLKVHTEGIAGMF